MNSRARIHPTVTINMKISVEIAQKMKVCPALEGPKFDRRKEPCHTTSTTLMTSSTLADQ